ncbi:TraR/DksA family transcriptional regulator [Salmonella enterica]|uniref:TraR/DksA family transcriptional regulator n=1 Tax=Salmonella enterica TaxID=28901 RepID=UPI003D31DCD6
MDEIDRDQEFNERQLELMIARSCPRTPHSPSLKYCRQCGETIPVKRQQMIPGVTLCIDCQTESERKNR